MASPGSGTDGGEREPVAEATGVTLAYGRHTVLADAGFRLPAAAWTAVVGPNGSGKSTILRALAGLLRPSCGELRVLGTEPVRARSEVRYVAQRAGIDDRLPLVCRDVVMMGRWGLRGPWRRLRPEDREAVRSVMERLGIVHLAGRRLGECSGGERQRTLLAQGLVRPGEVLLLDEPASGLDAPTREVVRAVIADERAAGRAVVVVTHDLTEAAGADHVLLVGAGSVRDGPPGTVLRPEAVAAAYGLPTGVSPRSW